MAGSRTFVAVEVEPGNATEVDLRGSFDAVRLELAAGPGGGPPSGDCALVPLDPVGRPHLLKVEQGIAKAQVVLPGRYVLLLPQGGGALVDVRMSVEVVDLGAGALTVRDPAGARMRLVPHPANELVDLLAWRLPSGGGTSNASGGTTFAPLRAGTYRSLLERGRSRTVELGLERLEIDLCDGR